MSYYVRDDLLTITSAEKAANELDTRVYDASDLAPATPTGGIESPGEYLVNFILTSAVRKTWENAGGPGSVKWSHGVLIVSQTEAGHAAVRDVLKHWRTMRERMQSGDERALFADGTPLEARRKLLDQRADIHFEESTLEDVANILERSYGIQVEIDMPGLEDVGAARDTTVTARYRNITLRSALRVILGPLDLRYVFYDDVLVFTSAEKAANEINVVVYPVRGLVALMERTGTQDEFACREELAELIAHSIAQPTWDEDASGVKIRSGVEPGVLVCYQTDEVHLQIDEFLTKLRATHAARKKRDEPAAQAAEKELRAVIYPLVGRDGGPPPEGFAREVSDVVRKLVAPDSWKDEKTAWIGSLSNLLIVRQRPAVQREVAEMLKKLGVLGETPASQMSGQGGGGAAL
jgi:hypothetical protein